MKILKRIAIILACIIALFIIFNPSPSAFKNYASNVDDNVKYREPIFKRKANWLIFSIYTKEWVVDNYHSTDKYVGIIGNFFFINEETEIL